MAKIKLNWKYAQGELDTDTLKLVCIPARGKRIFGADELDAELCIKDGMNYQIAEIHLGDVESSNILCEEIVRRFNRFPKWRNCRNKPNDYEQVLVKTRSKRNPIRVAYYSSEYKRWYICQGYLRPVRVLGWIPIQEILDLDL